MTIEKSNPLQIYFAHLCDNGWADCEALSKGERWFLFRGNLVDDHISAFIGLPKEMTSELTAASGAIVQATDESTRVELFRDNAALEAAWTQVER